MQQGDMVGALDALNRAIEFVAPQDHKGFAELWCDRGLLLEQLNRPNDARESFATCEAWRQGK